MKPLSAIRIFLYGFCSYFAFTSNSLSGVFVGVGCVSFAVFLLVIDYNSQELYSEPIEIQERAKKAFGHLPDNSRREGMWCRMCGGACDLENCGMEQP